MTVFVQFTQESAGENPVDLGVTFAFDKNGKMGARRYVNFDENLSSPQSVHFIKVSGDGSWHGAQQQISSYAARFPILGPYAQVFVYNQEVKPRTVSVWAYLVG
jgi:hypothetical protein